MKRLLFIPFMILLCYSCEKDRFDIENPDVAIFVRKLKDGTYDYYEKGEIGEGIRNGCVYGSLDPFLIDTVLPESERHFELKCDEILIVRGIYGNWWNNYKNKNWKEINTLDGTTYK